jgi:hypothetical protein
MSQPSPESAGVPPFRGHPDGSRLPALEQNLLKYRALEMVLFLFYAEEMKRYVVGSLDATDRLKRAVNRERRVAAEKNSLKRAWRVLIEDGVLSECEAKDLRFLIDYRNTIAHRIHDLTSDIGKRRHWVYPENLESPRRLKGRHYDDSALERLRGYYDRFLNSSTFYSKYVILLSTGPMKFDSAAACYESELRRLRLRIERLWRVRREEDRELLQELAQEKDAWERWTKDSLLKSNHGRLTRSGVAFFEELLSRGRSSLAIAYLLGISQRSVERRRDARRTRRIQRSAPGASRQDRR